MAFHVIAQAALTDLNFTRWLLIQHWRRRFQLAGCLMRLCLAMMILIASASSVAAAGAEERTSGFSGSLGIGVASLHDYAGGGETRAQPAPLVTLQKPTRFGVYALDTKGLSWTPLDMGTFRAGVLASYDAGRTDEDPANSNYRPGSDYLRGMGDIDGAPVAGGFFGWTSRSVTTDVSIRRILGGRGRGGVLADLSATIPIYSTSRLQLAAKPGATWANTRHTQLYFGVTPQQAGSSLFPIYQAGAGIQSAQIDFIAAYALTSRWSVMTLATYYRLVGDAADSPIVQERGYPQFAAFIVWTFGK
jgi:outer membrane scaffolding protein for murein synthesis (MipA/OmpV family)